ncbi:MAG: glycosyltransferase family protein [Zoogloeaceae bacterium]|jgi:glycosyltransferase involved in cell wall biosynthesis|nr:glycosyltransferase family protein [Zoogloeaceae bacterium]
MNLPENPSFSVVICSVDALKFAQVSMCYEQLLAGFPHEIIGVRDARSLAESYNRALRHTRGDIVIFSHDDILILDPDFGRKISQRLLDFDILGFAGTRRVIAENWWHAGNRWSFGAVAHSQAKVPFALNIWNTELWPVADDIQGIDGLCIVARREVAEEIGFDEATFNGFHLYDLDFSFSAWRAGKKLGVCCDIPVIHASLGSYNEKHINYGLRFVEKHKDALPENAAKVDKAVGAVVVAQDYHAIRALWRKDIFRRAMSIWEHELEKADKPISGQFLLDSAS